MDRLVVLLAPLAVLLLGAAPIDASQVGLTQHGPGTEAASIEPDAGLLQPTGAVPLSDDEFDGFPASDSFRAPIENQVRIEQRITIRIAPRSAAPRSVLFDMPDRGRAPRISERGMGKCLPIGGIAGVQVGDDNRLTLFMRDRRTVSLGLEKSCRAQDFYSGFYVERSPDGQLCVGRDRLQSRSGANCAMTRLRQLVIE